MVPRRIVGARVCPEAGPMCPAFSAGSKKLKQGDSFMRFVCTFLVFSALVWGQAFQGSLRGRVTDPKDAVVPLAKVSLIDVATSVSSTTVTNSDGQYSFPVLNPSTYELVIEAPGFKKLEQKGIVIIPETANTQDAKLEIGQVTETVDVTAEAELLNVSEASTGTDIDRQKMEDLPNLGRDPFMLARRSEEHTSELQSQSNL